MLVTITAVSSDAIFACLPVRQNLLSVVFIVSLKMIPSVCEMNVFIISKLLKVL